MNEKLKILIIDDEVDICEQINGLLGDNSLKSVSANTSDEAFKILANENICLVILDIWLNNSKLDGFETMKRIKEFNENLPVIMISGHGNVETAVSAIKNGAYDYLEKPFESELLIFKVNKAIENVTLKLKLNELTNTDLKSEFVYESKKTESIFNLIKKVSKTESSILLTGPAGSGKEIIAKTIHRLSNRSKKLFYVISCANLSSENFEKELFGIEKEDGFFEKGVLEKINGGTIVFDQIEDLSLKIQGKLTRFLETQSFTKLNSTKIQKTNLRIIATSKSNLTRLINDGKFREDLFFKLNVLPIEIPSLKDRSDDIKSLCNIFLNDFIVKNNLKRKEFNLGCIEYFKSLNLRGNVRELKNLVEWILITLSDDNNKIITFDLIPEEIKLYLDSSKSNYIIPLDLLDKPFKQSKEMFEKNYIEFQLKKNKNNIFKTSEFIGMERTALYRKIKNLNIKINENK